jgi:hypothetical protein
MNSSSHRDITCATILRIASKQFASPGSDVGRAFFASFDHAYHGTLPLLISLVAIVGMAMRAGQFH